MSLETIGLSLAAALIGGLVVAAVHYYITRKQTRAGADSLRLEAEKARLEAEQARAEAEKARSEALTARDEAILTRNEAECARQEALATRAEALQARAEAEKSRLEAANLSAEFIRLRRTVEDATQALQPKENVLYDSKNTFESNDFEGQGSVIAGSRLRIVGQGSICYEDGILKITRQNPEGGYIAHLRRYIYYHQEWKWIPKNELSSGKRILKLLGEAKVTSRRCKFRFVISEYPSLIPLEVKDFDVKQGDWTPIELLFKVSASLACYLQIHQAEISEPNTTMLRNLLLVEIYD
jgi:hypothetical protein